MRDHRHRRERPCKERILRGLERLEYRGYDSAGIVLVEDDELVRARKIGKVEKLRAIAGSNGSPATLGMGHTRWATHGGVVDKQRAPVRLQRRPLRGAHERHLRELRRAARGGGREGLRAHARTPTPRRSCTCWPTPTTATSSRPCARVYPRLEGHFAFLALALDQPDRIVGARLAWPPLVVGVGEGETFIASFTPAFLEETRRVQHVREGEIVEITPDGARFWPVEGGEPIERADRGGRRLDRGRREGRLRDVHAEGDPRAAHRDRRHHRRAPARRRAAPGRHRAHRRRALRHRAAC